MGRCGGVITLEDNDPCGTLFSLFLPKVKKTMTEPLTLLIVEDETLLAEMHAEYIRHIPSFNQIWLAGNLAQARMMIDRFKLD